MDKATVWLLSVAASLTAWTGMIMIAKAVWF